jgi:rhodanese-related sulfurtransferase
MKELVLSNEQTSMAKPLSAEASIEHQTISRDELRARLRDRSLIILDVLPKEAYAEAHIPGAISLPVAEIEAKARQAISNLTQEIVVYCGGPT